jgi:hypothetical protein
MIKIKWGSRSAGAVRTGHDKPHERRPRAVLNGTTSFASLSKGSRGEVPQAPPADQ